MPLGRRGSKNVSDRYAADRELADAYRERLRAAVRAEDELRRAQAVRGAGAAELREPAIAFDRALTEALLAAEAAERVAMGPGAYPPAPGQDGKGADKARRAAEIARRRAKAKSAVQSWTGEVDRLRTAREAHRLSYRVGPGVAA